MSDEYIRKADAIKQCGFGMTSLHIADNLRKMRPADVVQVETLKAEIYKLKCQQDCKNQDYYTGYMSALSTVEGILAEVGEE